MWMNWRGLRFQRTELNILVEKISAVVAGRVLRGPSLRSG